jgi:hypothetical protein
MPEQSLRHKRRPQAGTGAASRIVHP